MVYYPSRSLLLGGISSRHWEYHVFCLQRGVHSGVRCRHCRKDRQRVPTSGFLRVLSVGPVFRIFDSEQIWTFVHVLIESWVEVHWLWLNGPVEIQLHVTHLDHNIFWDTQIHSARLSDTQRHSATLRIIQLHLHPVRYIAWSLKPIQSKEINGHCRQVIVDHHRWLNTWSTKTFTVPHIHGDLREHIPPEALPQTGTFRDRVEQVNAAPLLDKQYCYTHRCYCSSLKETDLEMSGLPCEENSRANTRRRFFEGRFSNLYAIWSRRQRKLGTKLIILENTEETWNISVVGFQFCPYWFARSWTVFDRLPHKKGVYLNCPPSTLGCDCTCLGYPIEGGGSVVPWVPSHSTGCHTRGPWSQWRATKACLHLFDAQGEVPIFGWHLRCLWKDQTWSLQGRKNWTKGLHGLWCTGPTGQQSPFCWETEEGISTRPSASKFSSAYGIVFFQCDKISDLFLVYVALKLAQRLSI